MHIGNEHEYIELIEQERMPDTTPTPGDVRLKVNVRLKGFYGSSDSIWIEKPEMEHFLLLFSQLVQKRTGKAKLKSMSPDEFWLEIRSFGTTGRFAVEVHLKHHQYSGETLWPTVIAGGFELDPAILPYFEKEFVKLIG